MGKKSYILCPGQGAQAIGMGKDFFESSPIATETFEKANKVLGFDLANICFNGPEDRLNQTDISQPAIYVTSIASFRAVRDAGVIDPLPVDGYAGLSLGEYSALYLGGAFSFEDGLKLVAARGSYMQEAAVATPSGMVAILGADEAAIDKLCAENRGDGVLVPANFNAPGQIVVSGSTDACERALNAAEAAGFKATALKVAGAFHSPLMQRAADRMKAELEKVAIRKPDVCVWSNVTAQPHEAPESIRRLLVDQIVKPVKWEQTVKALLAEDQEPRLIELAPGRTLAGLIKRINRRLPVQSAATAEALVKKEG